VWCVEAGETDVVKLNMKFWSYRCGGSKPCRYSGSGLIGWTLRVLLLAIMFGTVIADESLEGDVLGPTEAAVEDGISQVEADESADSTGRPMTSGEALVRKLMAGGWTIFFLVLASVVAVSVTLERLVRLRRRTIVSHELAEEADRLWREQDFEKLERVATVSSSTLGRVIVALVRYRHSAHPELNTIAGDIASRDLRRHLQKAYPLLVVATVSPLLGLLGTVVGMIGAFSTIEALGELANPAAFGGDISKALITTGAGLAVAVPSLTMYHFFKSRILALGVDLEEIASELIVDWCIAPSAGESIECSEEQSKMEALCG